MPNSRPIYNAVSDRKCFWFMGVLPILLAASGVCGAKEQGGNAAAQPNPVQVEFKAMAIHPSYDGESYEGCFRFINYGADSLDISGWEEPKNRRFRPTGLQYQILKDGQWIKVETTSGGFLEPYKMTPGTPYEFFVELSAFEEQDTPLTARVGLEWDRYWSEPFVLDWKSDRKAGKFLAARKAHLKKVREAFGKVGFRKELLDGDEYPDRLVKEMLSRLIEDGASFEPLRGELMVATYFLWNGNINVEFRTVGNNKVFGGYAGNLEFNPDKLTRNWFRKHRIEGVGSSARELGQGMDPRFSKILMAFDVDDDTERRNIAPTCSMHIFYDHPSKSARPMPLRADCIKACERAMDAVEGWFSMHCQP